MFMKLLICFSLVNVAFLDDPDWDHLSLDDAWTVFKQVYNKSYPNATEEARRKEIFATSLATVKANNADYAAGILSYTSKIYPFNDESSEEFAGHYLGIHLLDD